jgi:hypothetical protein
MTQENLQFSFEQFRDKYPFPHLQMGAEELEAFPPGLLDDREREVFASLMAGIDGAQDIARSKGIILGLRTARGVDAAPRSGIFRQIWERFKGPSLTTFRSINHAQRYLDVDVYDLKTTERSIPSDTGWAISQIAPIDRKTQVLSSCEYTLPLGDEEKGRLQVSQFGERYLMLQGTDKYAETGVALCSYRQKKEHSPLFVVTKSFGGKRIPVASYMSSRDSVYVGINRQHPSLPYYNIPFFCLMVSSRPLIRA